MLLSMKVCTFEQIRLIQVFMKIRSIIPLFIFLLTPFFVHATHQRAGEITYLHINGLTYEITVVTYTYSISPADRCELEVIWGDGSASVIPRVNGPAGINPGGMYCDHLGEIVDTLIRKNVYSAQHTFASAGEFIISVEDPNRNYGVINIPNSVNVPLYVDTKLLINPFLGTNSSPQLTLPPIDKGCVEHPFIHNAGAYDPDGDSLSYELVACRGTSGMEIPGYTLPEASNSFTINPVTGDILWDYPVMQGEYNIAFIIKEWRNGVPIGYVTRDMQIIITSCDNEAPQIETISDTCIMAGETLELQVTATDADNDKIKLVGSGGPILAPESPAVFPESTEGMGTVTAPFVWNTQCSHVRYNPWQLYFKATDNSSPVNLSDIMTLQITVIGPPPQPTDIQPIGNTLTLQWLPYSCPNAQSIRIYRREGSYPYSYGACETGVPEESGYILADEVPADGMPSFTDHNNGMGLIHGIDYCYRLTALFPDGAESYVSEEICASLKKDLPVITHVSVEKTDPSSGKIRVQWAKPTELDYQVTPGPFKYILYRSNHTLGTPFLAVDSLNTLTDTLLMDTDINTSAYQFAYFIEFINDTPGNRFTIGMTQIAQSPLLSITPTDRQLNLSWEAGVPWNNSTYDLFRYNEITTTWDSLTTISQPYWADTGLINGKPYCYLIRTRGSYSASGIISPILNHSQEACGTPIDNIPPCPVVLSVHTDCDKLENHLAWTNPLHACGTEVSRYVIYAAPDQLTNFQAIDSINNPNDTTYIHHFDQAITGCYFIIGVDETLNRSAPSNTVCIPHDTCSVYQLPNVFTPNNDGYNDIFTPFPYTSIEKAEAEILNRWGQVIFRTDDPNLNWDGRDQSNNKECATGVYFYVINLHEITLQGLIQRTISGQVHLLRE